MAIGEHAIVSSAYDTKTGITASTDKRDVSQLLDLWAHKNTPLLNRISWGAESGGLGIEWVSEHLGFGYIQTSGALASDATAITVTTSGMGLTTADAVKQVQAGTLLYTHVSGDAGGDCFFVVASVSTDLVVEISQLVATSEAVAANSKLYIVGHYVNEGSEPFPDISRKRSLLSNTFSILRKDIKITGSMAATDMHAVANEPNHQMALRLLEMQFERERTVLFSKGQARTSVVASFMKGIYDFLDDYSGNDWVDASTTTLTESKFNALVAECWDNAGNPDLFVANKAQIRKFTQWDSDRIRTVPDARLAGHWVTRYLTDVGIEVELLPLRKSPVNLGFILDTSLIKLRAKKGRKLFVDKLAKVGDYDRWQLISEYTLEMRKAEMGAHGMFTELT